MKYKEIIDRFIIPNDKELILRAIPEDKAKDLLKTQELFFARADNGSYGKLSEAVLSIADKEYLRKNYKDKDIPNWEEDVNALIQSYENCKSYTFLNCWSNSKIETRYIWNTYGKIYNSIILKTTVIKLKNELIQADNDFGFDICKVDYIDPVSGHGGIGNTTQLFSRKFDFDRKDEEIRAIIQLDNPKYSPTFLRIKVDLKRFLDEIIIHHNASPAFKIEINNLCEILGIKPRISTVSSNF
jgi:hypothetical protein